jgi:outer membrane protein insertion porin family
LRDFKPFEFKRAAGLGARVFLPMFGMLGFDYGVGFDKGITSFKGKSLKEIGTFNIIIGFEPE